MIKAKTIKSKNQLVIPLGNAWAVKSEGSLKFSFITDTKKEALDYAKVIAANNNTDLIVYGKDGKVAQTSSYKKKEKHLIKE